MIYFIGDVHGAIDRILPAILRDNPGDGRKSVVFLGDIEPQRPFEDEARPLVEAGIGVWFIHGNHDTDNRQVWENLQLSRHRNLHGRVVEIEGLRVAGLGGVFRGEVWYPPAAPVHLSYTALEASEAKRQMVKTYRNERALKRSSTIFPETYEALADLQADILVTHEAPSCHPHGFASIDLLAQVMGVRAVFHGHQHDSLNYREWDDRLGFKAHGVGLRGITDMNGVRISAGELDEARRHRQRGVE